MATEAPPPSEGEEPGGRPADGADDAKLDPGASASADRDPTAPGPVPTHPTAPEPGTDPPGTGQEAGPTPPPRVYGVARLPPVADPYDDEDFYDPEPYGLRPNTYPAFPYGTRPDPQASGEEEPIFTWRPPAEEPWPTWPKPAKFSAVAQFEDPYGVKPQHRTAARAQIPPTVPLDPILPYISPPVPRRRRSEWPVLVIALIIFSLIMMGCCIAGFALFNGYGGFIP